jgi:hypothetical protein
MSRYPTLGGLAPPRPPLCIMASHCRGKSTGGIVGVQGLFSIREKAAELGGAGCSA